MKKENNEELYVSVDEFCSMFEVDRSNAYAMVSDPQFGAIQISGIWYLPKELVNHVQELIANRKEEGEENELIILNQDTFAKNIAGCRAEVELLRMVSNELKGTISVPAKNSPKGLILHGEPGSGKTFMGECLCTDSGRRVFRIRWDALKGHIIEEIALLFEEAKKAGPSILFFDDIDKYGFSEVDWIIFQNIMDQNRQEDIFICATATNLSMIMPSVIRPGRFDLVLETNPQDAVFNYMVIAAELGGTYLIGEQLITMISNALVGENMATIAEIARVAGMRCSSRESNLISKNDFKVAMLEVLYHIKSRSQHYSQMNHCSGFREIGKGFMAEYLQAGTVRYAFHIVNDYGEYGCAKIQNLPFRSSQTIQNEITVALAGKAAVELAAGFSYTAENIQEDIQCARNLVGELMSLGVFGFEFTCVDWAYASAELQAKREAIISEVLNTHYNEAVRIIYENWLNIVPLTKKLLEDEFIMREDIREALPREDKQQEDVSSRKTTGGNNAD